MKKKLIYILTGVLFVSSCSFTNKSNKHTDKEEKILDLVVYQLQKSHYKPVRLDDSFSTHIFNNFIQSVDSQRRYLLQSDIDLLKKHKLKIDDEIKSLDISFFEDLYNILEKRIEQSELIFKEVVKTPLDFTEQDKISDKPDFSVNESQQKEHWRKLVKLYALPLYYNSVEDEKKPKKEKDYKPKTLKAIEEESRNKVLKTLEESFYYQKQLTREDYFGLYLKIIAMEFDPHTEYFRPEDKDSFDVGISGKIEGIGVVLNKKPEGLLVASLVQGGPTWRGKFLKEGDLILGVAQEGDKKFTDVLSMKLSEATRLIKGPKGTTVTLTVRRGGSREVEEVRIVRDVIEFEESHLRSAVAVRNNKTYGVIYLPLFYIDFKDYAERNAASDMKKEIERLKKEDVDGIIIDLRDNGGGSLRTVVDMAGYFIEQGPIVQVKTLDKHVEFFEDKDKSILWAGSMVVLVDEMSGSASEIFAAAMQDYKRAIIIGSKQTYGKGTVQHIYDLNQLMKNKDYGDVGALKTTIQKYYRVNGKSTQLKGVSSDIVLPDQNMYLENGERSFDNPMSWDSISVSNYKPYKIKGFDQVVKKSKQRAEVKPIFEAINESAKWIKSRQDQKEISLNYLDFEKEKEKIRAFNKKYESISDYKSGIVYKSLPYEEQLFKTDTILKEKRRRWHEELNTDPYVEEAINVLEDMNRNR